MKHDNKDPDRVKSPAHQIAEHLQRWVKRNGHVVHDQILRGAAHQIGTGAVSLVLIWFEARHW